MDENTNMTDFNRNLTGMIHAVEDGYDFINGNIATEPRVGRLTEQVADGITSKMTGVFAPNDPCGLKLFKVGILIDIDLYGQFHKFLPTLAAGAGYKILSYPLDAGDSKYIKDKSRSNGKGLSGLFSSPVVFLDILSLVCTTKYLRRPLHLFGNTGMLISTVGFLIDGYLAGLRLLTGTIGGHNTLLMVGTMMIIIGIQLLGTGLLAELMNRVFFNEKSLKAK